jgi:hypothetical protein
MTEPSNVRILSDDDAQALLPILESIGAIVERSSGPWSETLRQRIRHKTIGKRRPPGKTILKYGKVWRY